jgi:hypothetical protein
MLTVALVALTFAMAVNLTLSVGAVPLLRRARRRRARDLGRPARPQPVSGGARRLARLGAADAESVLVALLLAGRLSRSAYRQQMAELAATDSARRARP